MSIEISIKTKGKKRDVVIPVEWKDITVKYWGELATIIKKHYLEATKDDEKKDTQFEELIKASPLSSEFLKDDKLTDAQVLKMNADVFSYITGLSREETELVDVSQINQVLSTINILTQEYKPQGVDCFDFEGETFYFPSEFLKRETFGEYIEATQLDMYIKDMENGRFDVLPQQMAILCRKEDEVYDDEAIPEKAEKFKNLTMDIIWEFSFFLTQRTERLQKLSLTYLAKHKQEQE
tara:strand:- start:1285 stop:1995 length:711 start_codon:yes stop_codon:yes gene_type:complete